VLAYNWYLAVVKHFNKQIIIIIIISSSSSNSSSSSFAKDYYDNQIKENNPGVSV
jgi:hypothetical protein